MRVRNRVVEVWRGDGVLLECFRGSDNRIKSVVWKWKRDSIEWGYKLIVAYY